MKNSKKRFKLYTTTILVCSAIAYTSVKQVQFKYEIQNVESDLEKENKEFIDILNKLNIENITLTTVGNSISNGLSMKDESKPLLERNEQLFELLEHNDITCETFRFNRWDDNFDEYTYGYLINNIKQSEINKMNISDYTDKETGKIKKYIEEEKLYEYFPLVVDNDKGLNDIVKDENIQSNIIVYNGGTGAFLNNILRHSNDIFNSFNEDAISVEAFCKTVFLENPNVQIYLCGLPNYFNMDIINIINIRYKDIASHYPNVTYVEPAPAKYVYMTEDGLFCDAHYDKQEYLCHNKHIIDTINNNYISNLVCIDIYETLRNLDDYIQFEDRNLKDKDIILEAKINDIINKYERLDIEKEDILKGIDKFLNLYKERAGDNFYYIPKDIMLNIFEEYRDSKVYVK